MESPGAHIPDHVVAFGRMLRRIGMAVTSQQVMDAARALRLVGIERRDDVRAAFSAVFVVRRADRGLFDLAFNAYWSAHAGTVSIPGLRTPLPPKQFARVQRALGVSARQEQVRPASARCTEATYTFSAREALSSKDFAAMTESEVEAAASMLRQWTCGVECMRVRRMKITRGGRRLHMPTTFRKSLQQGTEVFTFGTQDRKMRPRSIVMLCDISGSMERYCRMLLHFMHTMTQGFRCVEGFVFGTRLTRITRCLRERDTDAALERVAQEVRDWGGGTRTGKSLRDFNVLWLRRVLRSSGIVLIISDGIDRGDPSLLGAEMARLQRSCHRLAWLNPLLGYADYQPVTRGMRAALPHVTQFLPVHNLESLADLGAALQKWGGRRRRNTRVRAA